MSQEEIILVEASGATETIDLSNINLGEDVNAIIIRGEDGSGEVYIPCLEDGEYVLEPLQSDMLPEEEVPAPPPPPPPLVPAPAVRGFSLARNQPPQQAVRVAPHAYSKQYRDQDGSIYYRCNDNGLIRLGRKHIIIDQRTMISPKEFKRQLTDSSDLVSRPKLRPKTKREMRQMQTGLPRLFAYPSHAMLPEKMLGMYRRNCNTQKQPSEVHITDMDLQPVGYKPAVDPAKIRRIYKRRAAKPEEKPREEVESQTKQEVYLQFVTGEVEDEEEREQIIFLHDPVDEAQDPIGVLLAAANSEGGGAAAVEDDACQHVIICKHELEELQANQQHVIVVEEGQDIFNVGSIA